MNDYADKRTGLAEPRQATPETIQRVSMREVADRAGVALSSVSRVLSGHPEVSTVMRNRVLDAVAALGYERNLLAQSLRKGTTQTVGFIVGDISNPLIAAIALGAETTLSKSGYTMLLANSGGDPQRDESHVSLLRQRQVDGLLLSPADETAPGTAAALHRSRIPHVLIDREMPDGGSVVISDHDAGITAATQHLIGLGHRRIGLITGSPRVRPSRRRATALRQECRKGGARAVVRGGSFTAEHGAAATAELLDSRDPPTAIVAGSNQILTGVLQTLRERSLRMPRDISLVTCDDVPLAQFLDPPLATVYRDAPLLGRVAADLLLELLAGLPPRSVTLPTHFRPANSCAPPPPDPHT